MSSSEGKDRVSGLLQRLAESPSDEVAWTALYQQLCPFVTAVAYRRLRDTEASRDVAQEVFIRLLKSQPFNDIHDVNQFRAYLWKMTINAANSYWSKSRLGKEVREEPWHEAIEVADTASNSEDRLAWKETVELAQSALDPKDAKLLDLLLLGKSLTEAANELGLSYSNAGVRLHRARRTLNKVLNIQE